MNTKYTKTWQMNLLCDGPPSELRIDALNTATPNMADKPTLDDGPSSQSEKRCLEYYYTNTWQMNLLWLIDPPIKQSRDALNTSYTNTWQMNILWPWWMHSVNRRIDALNTATSNLADEPTLANGPPQSIKSIDALNTSTQNLADRTYFGWWTPPSQSRIDALNTATPNLADEPTLANGPPN